MIEIKCNRCKKPVNEEEAIVMLCIVNIPYTVTKPYKDWSGFEQYNEIKKKYGEMHFCPDCTRDFDKFIKQEK